MKYIKAFFSYFTVITTGIIILIAIINLLNPFTEMPRNILLQIISSGAVTALVTTALCPSETVAKRNFIIRICIHYVLISAIMLFFGYRFGWVSLRPLNIIVMLAEIAAVYIFTFTLQYLLVKKEADDLNKQIQARKKQKNSSD